MLQFCLKHFSAEFDKFSSIFCKLLFFIIFHDYFNRKLFIILLINYKIKFVLEEVFVYVL